MKKIVIIGGGLGGLSLAKALQDSGKVDWVVLERDVSADFRSQGYALGIKGSGGIPALKRLGLWDSVRQFSQPMKSFTFSTEKGATLMQFGEEKFNDGNSPWDTLRVPRDKLRQALLQSVDSKKVRFGCEAVAIDQKAGRVTVRVATGELVEGDLVVLTDGSNSSLRQFVTSQSPLYSGLTAIQGRVSVSERFDSLDEGHSIMVLGPGASFFAYRLGGSVTWSFTFHARAGSLKATDPGSLKRLTLKKLSGWRSICSEIVEPTVETEVVTRGYYEFPLPKNLSKGSVLLIGDSAHSMTPFQGQGANMAMADAVELADQLLATSDWMQALKQFESNLVDRVGRFQKDSHQAAQRFHTKSIIGRSIRNHFMKKANQEIHAKEIAKSRS